ncbi:hypothetical protein DD237_006861 [Peronospora effusa]|uniref:Uncharacterized protein n=1 Tax=Peronospora effusa TaxID=542832 RepID=A0A3R7YPX1_9STRA|nr:hypothetical protein DD237_006861 [Peronospora effusa]
MYSDSGQKCQCKANYLVNLVIFMETFPNITYSAFFKGSGCLFEQLAFSLDVTVLMSLYDSIRVCIYSIESRFRVHNFVLYYVQLLTLKY